MRGVCLTLILCGVLAHALPAKGEVISKTRTISGMKVEYRVVLPAQYNPTQPYPGIIAFLGGGQEARMLDNEIKRVWRDQAEKRGYIVVLPAAPDGQLFFEGGKRVFPEFLKVLLSDYKILDDRFHIAGHSNGGLSAFEIAASWPQYFWSITGFPGFLMDATPARVKGISKMCIYMFAGELDPGWTEEMNTQAKLFRSNGMVVQTAVEKGQPHLLATLGGEGASRLFDQFEQARKGCSK
jgi:poly(3-hydroxybutyrate) depolymerase